MKDDRLIVFHQVQDKETIESGSKAAAKGDWCAKHDRAKSQCFICDPLRKEKYAAKYRAKYGKEPPPSREEEGQQKKAEKK